MTDENKKTVGWSKAITGKKYVTFEKEVLSQLSITNWELVEVKKFDEDKIEFRSKVIELDGEAVGEEQDVVFNTVSNPIKAKLKPILENKDPQSVVKLQVMMLEKGKYSIKELDNTIKDDTFPPEPSD